MARGGLAGVGLISNQELIDCGIIETEYSFIAG